MLASIKTMEKARLSPANNLYQSVHYLKMLVCLTWNLDSLIKILHFILIVFLFFFLNQWAGLQSNNRICVLLILYDFSVFFVTLYVMVQ